MYTQQMPRPRLKTITLTVRLEPRVKKALASAASAERRSLANMLEVAVLAYCDQHVVENFPHRRGKESKS
jgi:hypothetical protein